MKSVLILGSGLVARPIIRYLLEKNYSVTVASNTPDRANELIAGHPNGKAVTWEAGDEEGLGRLVAAHDITVSLLPYVFHVMVAKHCVSHKKNMVTTSYVKPEMRDLDGPAREAGIIILNEIGLDPGIDHMSAMRIIDHIHEKEGAVMEFYSICGALPAPEAANNPFRYKFSWSPRGVVLAGNNDAMFLRKGQVVNIPTRDLFKDPFKVDFPGAGTMEVYPNRDSLAYKEIYGIPETQTLMRGTFRYTGWCETLDMIKRLNLISCDKIELKGKTYAEMVYEASGLFPGSRLTVNGSREVKSLLAGAMGLLPDNYALTALEWLGMFDNKVIDPVHDTTFDVTADLMIGKMGMKDGERDMVAMQHTFLAGFSDGRREVIRSRMLDFGEPNGDTAVARTVALPAAIAVEMILTGSITEKGVHIPVIPGIYNPVLDQLEKLGIRMVEEFGLPVNENIS
jgi:saccharopine dehydrogenase-like NADP-dependent oxidoreductase